MSNLKQGDTVVLVYTKEDLEDEDFGASGMVLKSPLEKFKYNLESKYMYIGCLKEDETRVLIQRLDYRDHLKGEPQLTFSNYIRKWTREDEDAEWEKRKWDE